ncbi:hypothetical protein B0H17DRAFT_1286972 [Mycena rosella]|uniref:Uncharacterized protein n=1 Tax=Mycena rosella TaxID=1033263 RepID=A0AAD7DJ20_MYCRO|nr:hypothetical protein B0H17DRAFT_1286972 [Mycena rosella]
MGFDLAIPCFVMLLTCILHTAIVAFHRRSHHSVPLKHGYYEPCLGIRGMGIIIAMRHRIGILTMGACSTACNGGPAPVVGALIRARLIADFVVEVGASQREGYAARGSYSVLGVSSGGDVLGASKEGPVISNGESREAGRGLDGASGEGTTVVVPNTGRGGKRGRF